MLIEVRSARAAPPSSVTITVEGTHGRREVRFPYHPTALAILRATVPDDARRWDRFERVWTIRDESAFRRFISVATARGFHVLIDQPRDGMVEPMRLGDVIAEMFGIDDEK